LEKILIQKTDNVQKLHAVNWTSNELKTFDFNLIKRSHFSKTINMHMISEMILQSAEL